MTSVSRLLRRLVVALVRLWALGLVALFAISVLWPKELPSPAPAEAIICLGAGMSLGGWLDPGPASDRRAETCAALYLKDAAPVIVFTGWGHHVSSAAEAMARVAAARGVPQSAMILEPEANSTIQNAVYAERLLPTGTRDVLLVSDAFHLPRAWVLFRTFTDLEPRLVAAPYDSLTDGLAPGTWETTLRPRSYLEWIFRESLALWSNLARALVYGAGRLVGVDAAIMIEWFD